MNLLNAILYDPGTAASASTAAAAAMTAFDTTNLRINFTVPASGMVRVFIKTVNHGATSFPITLLGVLEGSTVKGRVATTLTNPAAGAGQMAACIADFIVTGLTPGASLNWDAAYGVETGAASSAFKWGGPNNTTANDAFGAFVFQIFDPQPQTSGNQLSVDTNGRVDVIKIAGTTQTARDVGASVLLSSGTGAGQVKLSGGYVAPNWGDVGSPATVLNLSGTTIKTATDVEADTVDVQNRLPAALGANGNIKADVRDFGGVVGTFSSGRPEINVARWRGSTPVVLHADGCVQARPTSNFFAAATAAGTTTTIKVAAAQPLSTVVGLVALLKVNSIFYERIITASDTVGNVYTFYPAVPDATTNVNGDTIEINSNRLADVAYWQNAQVNNLISGRVDANAQVVGDKTGYVLSNAGVDAIWDEALAGHTTAGTAGKALIDAGTDPWIIGLPGAYGAGTAGFIVGTNLNAPVTSAKLAADGLDAISVADPGGPASQNTLAKMLVALWRRFFCKVVKDDGALTLKQYADNGVTVNSTQTYTVTATVDTLNKAT